MDLLGAGGASGLANTAGMTDAAGATTAVPMGAASSVMPQAASALGGGGGFNNFLNLLNQAHQLRNNPLPGMQSMMQGGGIQGLLNPQQYHGIQNQPGSPMPPPPKTGK